MTDTLSTDSLRMTWSQAPWDEVACGFPVLQITDIQVRRSDAGTDMRLFERIRENLGAGLVSCRLPHERLKESMLLEDHGFRFIEMMYSPTLDLADLKIAAKTELLDVSRACEADMRELLDIANTSFRNERFKMDPRLNANISDQRFRNWVASSLNHATQELYVLRDGASIISFFVIELLSDGTCYWHLNAVATAAQGQGYGRRVWLSMLNKAVNMGAQRVRSSIAARNNRALNLYARLGFKFPPPSMTFHWVGVRT